MATAIVMNKTSTMSSAAGILALLDESDHRLKAHALQKLFLVVDQFWAEVADSVPLIESLSEDESFPHRELAAAVASKCFFHLEEFGDSLRLALGAGKYFDISMKSEYVETIIAKCIDEYTVARVSGGMSAKVNPHMEAIVEKMFQRCYDDGLFTQALGVALEARRLDKVEESIAKSNDIPGMLSFCLWLCRAVVNNRDFRHKVIGVMVKAYRALPVPDHLSICRCLQILNDSKAVAEILEKLVRSDMNGALTAYQIAFDLSDNENQRFLLDVCQEIPKVPTLATATPASTTPATDSGTSNAEAPATAASVQVVKEDLDAAPPMGAPGDYWKRISQLRQVLSGAITVQLFLDFFYRKNDTDNLLLKRIKEAVENRNSVLHNATVVAHGYMNCGTTVDNFLRDNLDWLGRATNWAKFTATAGLGVVHKGHVKQSMNVLQPYLPQGGVSASPYSEGGALYALGLIHANNAAGAESVIEYLRNSLRNSGTDEVVQHGACLGLGLAAMAMHREDIYAELKNTLFTDAAVAGEGAGLSMGLLMLGIGPVKSDDAIQELISYAHDTKHEKIIRGAILGVALMMYGHEEETDALIEQLTRDKDPIVRYGGMYTIAMAYCGTSNHTAIRRLLHVAVSDVSDDVRRAAVTCLGFVMFRVAAETPKLVALLAESFNSHVRYGSCMAVGIACAGTGLAEAISLLTPMMEDAVDYVRQGAMIATAMVFMEESEAMNPKVKVFRDKLLAVITDKHQSTMTKMGAILAQGILDAGGRNATIALQSRNGFTRMSVVVGLMMWQQHWFWYPLMHFLSLALYPSAVIGLNKDLKMPADFSITCNAKPSQFAYPKHLEEKKEEKKERVATAVLSTTARAKARAAKLVAKGEQKPEGDAMEVDSKGDEPSETKGGSAEKKPVKEPNQFTLENPSRVTSAQETYIVFGQNQRYVPIRPGGKVCGIVMLKDTEPDKEEKVVEAKPMSASGADEDDADPPEPFIWEPPSN